VTTPPERGLTVSRLLFLQSGRWHKRIDGGDGGPVDPYSAEHCAYCARPVRPDAARLRTARTNDGEWWLVSADEDLTSHEWKDFQAQLDGGRAAATLGRADDPADRARLPARSPGVHLVRGDQEVSAR
jgi:hypothetical protein